MSPDIGRSSISPPADEPVSDRGAMRVHWRLGWLLGWRTLLPVAAALAYPFLVYRVLVQQHPWAGLLLALTALLGLGACLSRRRARTMAVLGVLALAAVAVAFAASSWMLYLPPVCVNLGLAWFFGHTLAPGREALITRFARLEHSEPDPRVLVYTRRLTWIWTVFFVIMAVVSVALAAFGIREAWVWFTAVGNYLCVAALFAIEYGYRRWQFPRKDHVSPRQQLLMMRAALRNDRE